MGILGLIRLEGAALASQWVRPFLRVPHSMLFSMHWNAPILLAIVIIIYIGASLAFIEANHLSTSQRFSNSPRRLAAYSAGPNILQTEGYRIDVNHIYLATVPGRRPDFKEPLVVDGYGEFRLSPRRLHRLCLFGGAYSLSAFGLSTCLVAEFWLL